jgi:hypothetical protein
VYKGSSFSRRTQGELLAEIELLGQVARRVRTRLGLRSDEPSQSVERTLELIRDPTTTHDERRLGLWLLRGDGKVFLQDADSLMLPAPRILSVLDALRRALPDVREMTTYARSRTLCSKSVAALSSLRQAGLTRVHVGLESGSDAVLALMEKGCRAEHHVEGCGRALAAGLEVACYVMPGLGGRARSALHAEQTSDVLRRIGPAKVRLRTLWIDPGSPLEAMEREGRFLLLEEHEVVAEIRALLAGLSGAPIDVVSDHDRNLLCDLEGRLDTEAPQLLAQCDRFLELSPESRNAFVLARRSGHCLHLAGFLEDATTRARFTEWAKELVAVGQGSLLRGMRSTLGRRSI